MIADEQNNKDCEVIPLVRMFLATVYNINLHIFILCCFVLLANFNTDYTYWLQTTWTSVTSLRMLAYVLFLIVMTFLQGFICSKIYLHVSPYHKSRFAKLYAAVTAQNLFLGMLYIIIGSIILWLRLSLKETSCNFLTTECNISNGTCLEEEHYFLLLSGSWSGLYYFINNSSITGNYFRFPVIAQTKFFRITRSIYAVFPKLMVSSIWSTLYYTTVYYFLRSYCHAALLAITSLQAETEDLDTVSNLISLTLLSQVWLHQFLFALTINTTYLLFEIYQTKWVLFKIGTCGAYSANEIKLTLSEAMSMDKIPIVQHLGYLDLVTIAQKVQSRRLLLFTLSQPGGHPYNWNCVVQMCTDLLKKFTSDLNAIFVKPQDRTFHNTKVLVATITPTLQTDCVYHMRKLVPDVAPPLTTETNVKAVSDSGWNIQKIVKQKQDAIVAYLLSKSFINYIFGEQDDNKLRYVLFNAQLVIWAAEAISSLTVFSLTEDSYGIVQKDVSNIIYVLLSVKQVLDKMQKSIISSRKVQGDDKFIKETFASLRSAIKRSLYRIVTNFEPYINELYLEPVKVDQLQSFLNYKE